MTQDIKLRLLKFAINSRQSISFIHNGNTYNADPYLLGIHKTHKGEHLMCYRKSNEEQLKKGWAENVVYLQVEKISEIKVLDECFINTNGYNPNIYDPTIICKLQRP